MSAETRLSPKIQVITLWSTGRSGQSSSGAANTATRMLHSRSIIAQRRLNVTAHAHPAPAAPTMVHSPPGRLFRAGVLPIPH